MSTGDSWHFNRERLSEALSVWKATGPNALMVEAVENALMDLIRNPLGWGTEDPTAPGVFHGSAVAATGEAIGILYAIPSTEAREIAVADIRTGR